MSTSYRDSQRYRKTYSFYRPLPRPEVMASGVISDQALKELDWKQSVRAASTADIVISSTITALDGVTLADGNRVLIKDQLTSAENGIYVWSSSTQLLTRSDDASQGTLSCGAACYVEEGSQSGSAWLMATPDPITVGTTSLSWVLFGGSSIFLTSGQSARTTYSASFGGTLYPDQIGDDVFFYVSGSSNEKAVFGGDTVVSGVLSGSEGIFLSDILEVVGEALVTGTLFVSGTSTFDSQMRPASALGSDVYFFVSGTISGSGTNDKKAVFGGDVRISGSLTVGTGSIIITSDEIIFNPQGSKIKYENGLVKFFDTENEGGVSLTDLITLGGGGAGAGGGGAGPQGAQGPQGPQGDPGAQGAVGSQGAAGAQGATGPAGAQGAVGATGSTGAQGATGATGAQGASGAQGPVGTQGAVGSTGATGAQGAAGAQGPIGTQGDTGAAGPTGAQGPVGAQGTAGPQGAVGTQGAVGPTGPQGAVGPDGAQGTQGAQGSAGAVNTVIFFGANTLTNGISTRYLIPGSGGTGSTVATQIGIPAPFAGSIAAIKAYHGTVDATYAITYTVRINGAPAASSTNAVIGISSSNSAGGGETIGNTTFVAGDVISVSCSYGSDASRTVAATVTLMLQ